MLYLINGLFVNSLLVYLILKTTNSQKTSRPEAAGVFSGEKRLQKDKKYEKRQLIWLAIK